MISALGGSGEFWFMAIFLRGRGGGWRLHRVPANLRWVIHKNSG